jgi:catechol-2,3-dioxygenase
MATKVLSPTKLAHVVLQSGQVDHMKQFYVNFLGGRIVYESEFIAFITYDDEHHRIAIVGVPGTGPKDHKSAGLVHIAYTFKDLKELCTAYRQRKALGMEPGWCVVSLSPSFTQLLGTD